MVYKICFLILCIIFLPNYGRARHQSSKPRQNKPNVLVLSAQAGWVHQSNVPALNLLQRLADVRDWILTTPTSLDQHFLNIQLLRPFNVIVFLVTSGPIFADYHKTTFRQYVEEGGSVVGVHSAVDTNKDWPFYMELVGAEFVGHPDVQVATLVTTDGKHPTTSFLPKNWTIREEFYNFAQPLSLHDKQVLVTVDETSYQGGTHGDIHPITWTRQHLPAGSRVWITVLGHTSEVYSSEDESSYFFQQHLVLGVEWAANGTALTRQRWTELQNDLASTSNVDLP